MQIYCDMTTDGGGWTLVARLYNDDNDMLYASNEWTSEGTGFGSVMPDGDGYRTRAFALVEKTELMICDEGTYGCNIDRDFSSQESLSDTLSSITEASCGGATRTMDVFVWGDSFCNGFWEDDAVYEINSIDQDGSPRSRITGTDHCDRMGGIGSASDLHEYNTNMCGTTTHMPEYAELYVR